MAARCPVRARGVSRWWAVREPTAGCARQVEWSRFTPSVPGASSTRVRPAVLARRRAMSARGELVAGVAGVTAEPAEQAGCGERRAATAAPGWRPVGPRRGPTRLGIRGGRGFVATRAPASARLYEPYRAAVGCHLASRACGALGPGSAGDGAEGARPRATTSRPTGGRDAVCSVSQPAGGPDSFGTRSCGS